MDMICQRLKRRFIIDRKADSIFNGFIPAPDDNVLVFIIRNDSEFYRKHRLSDLSKKVYTPHY